MISTPHSFRRNKKGIGTVFGMVFFLLITMIVFASFMVILNQNTSLEQTVIQTRQMDNDKSSEAHSITITQQDAITPFVAVGGSSVTVKCILKNTGTLPVQIERLWVKNPTTQLANFKTIDPLADAIHLLQPGQTESYIGIVTLSNPGSDPSFWFVTARGNTISLQSNGGSVVINNNSPETGALLLNWADMQAYDWNLVDHKSDPVKPGNNAIFSQATTIQGSTVPANHYLLIAATFTNMDPQQRTIVLTSESNIYGLVAQDTSGNPHNVVDFAGKIATVSGVGSSRTYSSTFTNQELKYNTPTTVYFGFILHSISTGGAETMPYNMVLYGYFPSSGIPYGQNIPFVTMKFVPSSVNVVIKSIPSSISASVTVNGTSYPLSSSSPSPFSWFPGEIHSIIFTPLVQSGNTQYTFQDWMSNFVSSSTSGTYTTPYTGDIVTANYKTQYQVSFNAPALSGVASATKVLTVGSTDVTFGMLPYQNWFDSGTAYSYSPTVASLSPGVQFALTGPSPSSISGVTGVTVTGTYKTQYQVSFNAPALSGVASATKVLTVGSTDVTFGMLPYQNWFDSGTAYSYSPTVASLSPGVQFALTGPSPSSISGVTGVTVTGTYKTQYKLTVTSAHDTPSPVSGSWFDANSQVTESVTTPADIVGGTQYRCTGWSIGSGGIPVAGSTNTVTFTITGPATITWNWQAQYQLTISSNIGAVSPISGSWFDGGSLVAISVVAPTAAVGEQYVWNGWAGSGLVSYTGTNNSPFITINGEITETAYWYHQYSQILSYSVVGGGLPFAPTATGGALGVVYAPSLTVTPTAYWFDASGSIVFSTSTGGAGERWAPNPASILATSAHTQVVSMYHQYQITFQYTIANTPAGTPTNPTTSYTKFGTAGTTTIAKQASPSSDWVDATSPVTYTNPISGSNERWKISPEASANPYVAISSVSGTTTANPTYYHQYQLTVTANPAGALEGSFAIQFTKFGSTSNPSQNTQWQDWADAGTTATASNPQSPFIGYTFSTYTNNPTTMNTAQTITINYTPPTIFSDNFENNWLTQWAAHNTYSSILTAQSYSPTHAARLRGGNNDNQQGSMTLQISTTGYTSIQLSYWRMFTQVRSVSTMTIEWQVGTNGGWQNLETISSTIPWGQSSTFTLTGADNQATIQIRFSLSGARTTDLFYVDDVLVTGQP